MRVGFRGEQGAGGVLGGVGRLDVEAGQGRLGEGRSGAFARGRHGQGVRGRCGEGDLTGRRVELGEQFPVLLVGLRGVGHGEDGGVFELAGEGVGDRALVGRRGCQAPLRQVVAVAQVGQDQRGVDRGDHAGDREPAGRDHLGHGLRLDRVPQFDDRHTSAAGVPDPEQFRHQVLAQGAAGAVVDEGRLGGGHDSGGVADRTDDGAGGGRRQVVVEYDAVGDVGEQLGDCRLAGVGVEAGDDHDREFGHLVRPASRSGARSARRGRRCPGRGPCRCRRGG